MLCPEVWNFEPPKHYLTHQEISQGQDVTSCIKTHSFNHSVSVVLPNINSFPETFEKSIIEDSDYYRIDNVHVIDLIDKEFIEAFIKKGELSLLSIEKNINVDNVIAITPTGHLVINLLRKTYQQLGIEGKPTFFERTNQSRYVITIDLKQESFTPGKKNYERIRNSLDKMKDLKFDVILAWDPPEETVCPSSIAAWFDNHFKTLNSNKICNQLKTCHIKTIRRSDNNVIAPLIKNGMKYDSFFEWVGLFSLGAKLKNETEEERYVSLYETPSPNINVGKVFYRQYTGFFTRQKIENIFESLKTYASENSDCLPWCCIDVQGFSDSPVSWKLKEHTFYVDGDNSYSIVLCPSDERIILRKSVSSNNKPRKTQ